MPSAAREERPGHLQPLVARRQPTSPYRAQPPRFHHLLVLAAASRGAVRHQLRSFAASRSSRRRRSHRPCVLSRAHLRARLSCTLPWLSSRPSYTWEGLWRRTSRCLSVRRGFIGVVQGRSGSRSLATAVILFWLAWTIASKDTRAAFDFPFLASDRAEDLFLTQL